MFFEATAAKEKDTMKKTTSTPNQEHYLFPVCSPVELLAGEKHQELLTQLQKNTGLDDEAYKLFYQDLVHNYADMVQNIYAPGTVTALLNIGLESACLAVKVQADDDRASDQLTTYMLFSAALLQGVGYLCENRRIDMCDEYGAFLQEWDPFSKPMIHYGEHYKVRYCHSPVGLAALVTPILARQIMPEVGWQWISEDQDMFLLWLALLTQMDNYSGTLGIKLSGLKRLMGKRMKESLLPKLPVRPMEPVETALGEAFWHWLRSGLAEKNIPINTDAAGVHTIEGGHMVLELELLFEEFARTHSNYRDMAAAIKQLKKIGVVKPVKVIAASPGPKSYKDMSRAEKSRAAVINAAVFYNVAKVPGLSYSKETAKFVPGDIGPKLGHVKGVKRSDKPKDGLLVPKKLAPGSPLKPSKVVKVKAKNLGPKISPAEKALAYHLKAKMKEGKQPKPEQSGRGK